MEQKRISGVFLICLLAILSIPVLFPVYKFTFFAPFLIIIYYQKSFSQSLWWSFFCGLLIDLLSANSHFGLHAIDYCATTWLLYEQRRHFFADSISTLPLMTYLFVLFSTVILLILLHLFGTNVAITWSWIWTDLIVMPLLDAAYAIICFALPSLSWKPVRRTT